MGCGSSTQSASVLAQTPAELLVAAAGPKEDEEIVDDKVKFLESIKDNDLAKVEECLRANAPLVNAATADGWTGLHYCATRGFDRIAQCLIENNADLNCKKKDGNTPLHNAAMNNNVNMIHLLVKFGAKIDDTNVKKQTALQIAIQYNRNESIAELESYERAAHKNFLAAIDDNIKSIKFDNAVNADEAVIVESVAVLPTNSDTVTIQDDDSMVSQMDDTSDTVNIATGVGDSNNWVEKYSAKYQRKYWKNVVDNTTSWNDPFKPTCNDPDYEVVYSATYGRYYFRHRITKEKTWNDPSTNNNSASTMLDANEILNTAKDEGNDRETKLEESVEEDNASIVDEKASIQPNPSHENINVVQPSSRNSPPPTVVDIPGDSCNTNDDSVSVIHRKPPPPPVESSDPVAQATSVEGVVEESATDISDNDAYNTNKSAVIMVSDCLSGASDAQSKRRPPSKMKFKVVDDDIIESNASSTSNAQSSIEQGTDTNCDSVVTNKPVVPLSKREQDKLIAEQAMAAMRKKREEKEKQNIKSEE